MHFTSSRKRETLPSFLYVHRGIMMGKLPIEASFARVISKDA